MADPNSWNSQGNGILAGLVGVPVSRSGRPNSDSALLWALRQAQANDSTGDRDTTEPSNDPLATLAALVRASGTQAGAVDPSDNSIWRDIRPFGQDAPTNESTRATAPLGASDNRSFVMALMGHPTNPSASSEAPSTSPAIPVGYDDSARLRPWWGAPPSVFDPWAEQFIKGMQGLIYHLRSSRGTGTPRGDDDESCYDRWQNEQRRCLDYLRTKDPRYLAACLDNARHRHNLCVGNGGKPRPDEPEQYDLHHIPNDPAGR